jgi:hypothetical protein
MKKIKVVYLKNFSRIPNWMKSFVSEVRFYFSETDDEIRTLNSISDRLDKFQYRRRNSLQSGSHIKRHIENNSRLYIGNSNSEISLVRISYE